MNHRLLSVAFFSVLIAAVALPVRSQCIPRDEKVEKQVETLLSKMTLRDKVGQMCELAIDKVLAVFDGENLTAGQPYVEGAKVNCKVLEHGKSKKVFVFHYKPKKNIRKKNGHRQPFTKLMIESISC